jgi:hypothetical protein
MPEQSSRGCERQDMRDWACQPASMHRTSAAGACQEHAAGHSRLRRGRATMPRPGSKQQPSAAPVYPASISQAWPGTAAAVTLEDGGSSGRTATAAGRITRGLCSQLVTRPDKQSSNPAAAVAASLVSAQRTHLQAAGQEMVRSSICSTCESCRCRQDRQDQLQRAPTRWLGRLGVAGSEEAASMTDRQAQSIRCTDSQIRCFTALIRRRPNSTKHCQTVWLVWLAVRWPLA